MRIRALFLLVSSAILFPAISFALPATSADASAHVAKPSAVGQKPAPAPLASVPMEPSQTSQNYRVIVKDNSETLLDQVFSFHLSNKRPSIYKIYAKGIIPSNTAPIKGYEVSGQIAAVGNTGGNVGVLVKVSYAQFTMKIHDVTNIPLGKAADFDNVSPGQNVLLLIEHLPTQEIIKPIPEEKAAPEKEKVEKISISSPVSATTSSAKH